MTVTHRCPECGIFAEMGGACPMCDTPLSDVATRRGSPQAIGASGDKAPAPPELPDEEPDQAERTVQRKTAPKKRTRRAAA
jgi:hypothetical protein